MQQLQLFLPCAAGVEDYLAPEVLRITGLPPGCITKQRGGVAVRTSLAHAMLLNLHSRLAQRVLVLLLAELPLKQAVKLCAEITGVKRNRLYERALKMKSAQDDEA